MEEDKLKYKEILCNTMKSFINICKEHNLQYYACAGTCLGAIRHKGMIPWDDDIDVLMPRSDYDKFLALKQKLQGTGYEIVDSNNQFYRVKEMMSSIMTKIWNIFSVQIQNIATRLTQDHKLWYSINNSNILKMRAWRNWQTR